MCLYYHRAALSCAAVAAALALTCPPPADARVTKLTITVHESPTYGGQSFGTVGQFEKYIGTATGEVDPNDRRNAIIQDIQSAPRNANGKVQYVATFTLIKPIDMSKGNGRLLYQVVNRGGRGQAYNLGGDPGDGFVQNMGFAMLWSGWQGDVVPLPNNANETIQVPVGTGPGGTPLTGPVLGRFSNVSGSTSQIIVYNAPIAWKPLTLDTTKATLVHNAPESIGGEISGPVTTVASTDWAWADCRTVAFPGTPDPTRVCLKAGFDPTQVYTLVYTGKDPMVLGLGLAATRDINAFFHHAMADDAGTPNPLAGSIKYVLSQGTSQSGNLIKTFLDLGFNEDELGRRVWDGANPHIAARQTPINFRFANPGGDASLYSPGSEPVVWWHTYQDKARDRPAASMLDRCHASHTCPKIFETNGSAEFWDLRMSPDMVGSEAQFDIPLVPEVRRYYMPSTSHGGGGGGFNPNLTGITFGTTGQCTLPANPNPESETIRALFVALNDWVVDGTSPPKSRYARLADHTLMVASGATVRFPTIPGIPSPNGLVNALLDYNFGPSMDYNDLTGVISIEPPIIKQHLPTVVPTVDADGNEQPGIKSVLAQAPLATYLGWNVTAGGAWKGQICAFTGGAVSFAQTRAARLAAGDPRPSIAERYGSQEGYNCAVTRAANRLQRGRYLLPADATRLIAQAAASVVLPSDPTNPVAQALCAQDDDASDDGDGHGDDGGGDAGGDD